MGRPVPKDIQGFVSRLRKACQEDRIFVTRKASDEAANDLEWDRVDVIAQLFALEDSHFHRTELSRSNRKDIIWVFQPEIESISEDDENVNQEPLWIRLIEKDSFVVVSFHEAEEERSEG